MEDANTASRWRHRTRQEIGPTSLIALSFDIISDHSNSVHRHTIGIHFLRVGRPPSRALNQARGMTCRFGRDVLRIYGTVHKFIQLYSCLSMQIPVYITPSRTESHSKRYQVYMSSENIHQVYMIYLPSTFGRHLATTLVRALPLPQLALSARNQPLWQGGNAFPWGTCCDLYLGNVPAVDYIYVRT
jgi:hypothetical protein